MTTDDNLAPPGCACLPQVGSRQRYRARRTGTPRSVCSPTPLPYLALHCSQLPLAGDGGRLVPARRPKDRAPRIRVRLRWSRPYFSATDGERDTSPTTPARVDQQPAPHTWPINGEPNGCRRRTPTAPNRCRQSPMEICLTCQNSIPAGQSSMEDRVDTEALYRRASTALNGAKLQVNGHKWRRVDRPFCRLYWVTATVLQKSGRSRALLQRGSGQESGEPDGEVW